ncbi:nose resistant to fluoxetine protein 6-like [Cloeon dipterum]|uniref:nose resistant to fluoxetine protein 6-like n=1 Tax=Cloeon dipterum TaxID=197152 RepID=UPI00321F6A34
MLLLKLLIFVVAIPWLPAQEVNLQCANDVIRTIEEALLQRSPWALRMIDATTKFPDGIYYGNWDLFGHWGECLSVSSNDEMIKGQFCRVTLVGLTNLTSSNEIHHLPRADPRVAVSESAVALKASICVPASCKPIDVSILVSGLFLFLTPGLPVVARVKEEECFTLETASPPLETWSIVFLATSGFIFIVLLVVTIADIFGRGNKLMKSLSAVTTTRQLLNTKTGSLGCINGLKVLSMLWVVLGHKYQSMALFGNANPLQVIPYLRQTMFTIISNAYLSVDSFFFIGGFLLARSFFAAARRQSFDVLKFYLYRYLRLTVPLAVMVAFYLTVLNHLGNGPYWYTLMGQRMISTCQQNWWQVLAYVNNYIGIDKQCVEQSWYTSVDMQLALLSPLLLLPLLYSPRAGLQLAFLLLALSCILPGVITYLNNYPWGVDILSDYFNPLEYVRDIGLPTHTRATPYLVGVILAFFMQEHTAKSIGISKKIALLGWTFSTGACLSVIFTVVISFKEDYVPDPIAAGFYAGLHKLGWSLGLAWIVFACANGLGGPVNAILSWRHFQPLSALTYSAYLTHLVVITALAGSRKVPNYASNFDTVHAFFGDIPFIFAASCILYYLVEAPVMVLLRYLFKKEGAARAKAGKSV